jgi:CTP synthase
MQRKTKWIVVTGGVISTLGKGIIASSIGMLLKSRGYIVSSAKIDPYINIDAGTMRPTEHGEVFVTFDGGETDQDIGNYERFMGIKVSKNNNLTTGQVYLEVISRERNLEYEGKCVEVIPHIPLEVERRLRICADSADAEIVIIEMGGTIGDYQNVLFLEALRTMKLKGDDIVFVHVAYLPIPSTAGEMKSKPAQHSLRALNANGIQADLVICRASRRIDDARREKISLFGNVPKENVISCEDVETIYEIPMLFSDQKVDLKVLEKLNEPVRPFNDDFNKWSDFVDKIKNPEGSVSIGIIGKYLDTGDFELEDSYISVVEAVKHACYHNGLKPDVKWISSVGFENNGSLDGLDGLIIPGGFGSSGIDGKLNAIRLARVGNVPFLGLCYGMQLAVIEHARNVLGLSDAHSAEIDPQTKFPVIDVLPEQKKNLEAKNYGATMRLGEYPADLLKGSIVQKLYNSSTAVERHRHRYEVNPVFKSDLEKKGLVFSGLSPDKKLVEFIERDDHPFFVGTQAHPEFTSNFLRPNPLFNGFIKAIMKLKTENEIKEKVLS